jgi:hypothetical protein
MLASMTFETVPFSARTAGPYTASVGQTQFSFDFPVLKADDLAVWRQRPGELVQLSLGLHYTVTGAGEQDGGAVVLSNGALDGDIIAIDGRLLQQRVSSYLGGHPFKTAYIDDDLNRLAIMVQELAREVGRSLRRAPVDEAAGSLMLPQEVVETTILGKHTPRAAVLPPRSG